MFFGASLFARSSWPLKGLGLTAMVLGHAASLAQPAVLEFFSYQVQKDERLSTLLTSLLQLPDGASQALEDLQKSNVGVDLQNLQTGQTLLIPKTWLQSHANYARVTQVQCSGAYWPDIAKPQRQALKVGDWVGEGDLLRMPPSCQVTMTLQDGSRIHIPSGAVVEIARLRTPKALGAPQVRLKLLEGRIGLDVFTKRPAGSVFEVQTPKTLAGVRGTQFRMGFESDTQNSRVEVLAGQVQNQGQSETRSNPLPQGTGQLVGASGTGEPSQTLPAAPLFDHYQRETTAHPGQLHFSSVPNARAYAWRNSATVNQFAVGGNRSTSTLSIEVPALESRAQAWHVSSVDRSGLQGLENTYALCQPATPTPDAFCSVAFDTSSFNGRPMQLTLTPATSSAPSGGVLRMQSKGPDNGRVWIGALRPGQYRYDLSHLPLGRDALNPDHWVLQTGLFQLINVHSGQR